jgi:hypothetical protein
VESLPGAKVLGLSLLLCRTDAFSSERASGSSARGPRHPVESFSIEAGCSGLVFKPCCSIESQAMGITRARYKVTLVKAKKKKASSLDRNERNAPKLYWILAHSVSYLIPSPSHM